MATGTHRIFGMPFSKVYPLYVQKVERKQRTRAEVDQVICWLTGYEPAQLQRQIDGNVDFTTFFAEAPAFNPNSALTAMTTKPLIAAPRIVRRRC